jgi:hypothetical protein
MSQPNHSEVRAAICAALLVAIVTGTIAIILL